jgi:hypothetical protein
VPTGFPATLNHWPNIRSHNPVQRQPRPERPNRTSHSHVHRYTPEAALPKRAWHILAFSKSLTRKIGGSVANSVARRAAGVGESAATIGSH